jgi:hypothetical protein
MPDLVDVVPDAVVLHTSTDPSPEAIPLPARVDPSTPAGVDPSKPTQVGPIGLRTIYPTKTIVVRNLPESGATDTEVRYMTAAANALLGELGAVWGRVSPSIGFRAGPCVSNERTFVLAGPGEYEKLPNETYIHCGGPNGEAKVAILHDEKNPSGPTVAKFLFLIIADEMMNLTRAHPIDIWSPVHNSSVPLDVSETPDVWIRVSLPNYVYPAWWAQRTEGIQLDRAGLLERPKILVVDSTAKSYAI